MNSICILGGGTSGFITALILKERFPTFNITVVKSDKVGTIGVGEGTTPHFLDFLKFVKISPEEIIKEAGATFKAAILFKNWSEKDFIHASDDSYLNTLAQVRLLFLHNISEGVDPKKLGILNEHLTKEINTEDNLPTNTFHFDNEKLINFLTKKSIGRGIEVFDDEIDSVHINNEGNTEYLKGRKKYFSDFFIDASGFKKVIVSKYDVKWVDVSYWLSTDSAYVYRTFINEVPDLWSTAEALDYGWKFKVPLLDKQGNGYIFDSNYISDEEALLELEKADINFDRNKTKKLKFSTGYLNKCWVNNCFATGLSGSFFEPLQASSIGTTIQQAYMLCNNLINYNDKIIERVNHQYSNMMKNVRDFIILHYATKKTNTKFWLDKSNMKLPDSLLSKLDLFKNRLPIEDDFSEDGMYALFKDPYYISSLYGLGMIDQSMIKRQYESLPKDVKTMLKEYVYETKIKDLHIKSINHSDWINEIKKGNRYIA